MGTKTMASNARVARSCAAIAVAVLALALWVGCGGDDGGDGPTRDGGASGADGGDPPGTPPPGGPTGTAIHGGWPSLSLPFGIAAGSAGETWIADTGNRLVRRIGARGATNLAIPHGEGRFEAPTGIAVDLASSRVWVSDPTIGRVVSFDADDGTQLVTVGGAEPLARPSAIAVERDGNVLVGEAEGGARLRRFAGADGLELSPWTAADASAFATPIGLAVTPAGSVWVLDAASRRAIEMDASGAVVRTIDGSAAGATPFVAPMAIAAGPTGEVWIVDASDGAVQRFDATGAFLGRTDDEAVRVPTGLAIDATGASLISDVVAGVVHRRDASGTRLDPLDGSPATLRTPRGLALAPNGDVWVADTGHGQVRAFDRAGEPVAALDGSRSTATLASPFGVAIDASGNRWVVEMAADRVRRFDAAGRETAIIDGTLGGRPALRAPTSIAIDREGDLWVADRGNHIVRELGPDGAAKRTIDGSTPGARQLSSPEAVGVDAATGNVWIADGAVVQGFDAAGAWLATIDGSTAGATPLSRPVGVFVDAMGRVWIADARTDRVQAFGQDGTWITTLRGGAESALEGPESVVVDADGNVWIADTASDSIRRYTAEEAMAAGAGASDGSGRRSQMLDPPLPDGYRFELSGTLTYSAKRYDVRRPGDTTYTYDGSARFRIVFVYDATILQFVADASQSRIEGDRTDTGPTGFRDCSGDALVMLAESIQTGRYTFAQPYDEGDGVARLQLPVPPVLALRTMCSRTDGPPQNDAWILGGRPEDHGTLIGPPAPEPPTMCPRREPPPDGEARSRTTVLPFGVFEIELDPRRLHQGSQQLWRFDSQGTVPHDETLPPAPGSTQGDCYESDWTLSAELRGIAPGANVVLGDSFAAATASPRPSGPCQRSPLSWGELYDQRMPHNTISAACSAAQTVHLLREAQSAKQVRRAQVEAVPHDAASVVLTIGGNDVDLFTLLKACVAFSFFLPAPASTYACDLSAALAWIGATGLGSRIVDTLRAIRDQANDAQIAILEYPDPLPRTMACDAARVWSLPLWDVGVLNGQLAGLHELMAIVNAEVAQAAEDAGVVFVRTQARFDADGGHDVCSVQPWFQQLWPLPPTNPEGPLHPNLDGNMAMAAALTAALGPPR